MDMNSRVHQAGAHGCRQRDARCQAGQQETAEQQLLQRRREHHRCERQRQPGSRPLALQKRDHLAWALRVRVKAWNSTASVEFDEK